jgi:anti-sigma factor RsiW
MRNVNFHPTEDELELFVLGRSPDQELETLETHILACNSCVTRLEELELEINATKLALRDMQREQLNKASSRQGSGWSLHFPVPKFSLVGAVVMVALGIIVAPAVRQHHTPVAEVSLSTYRGAEGPSTVPEGRRLQVHLNASDLAEASVIVEVVDAHGITVWKGRATIQHEQVDVMAPPITERGTHFLRVYAPEQPNGEDRLLREFAFKVE